MRRLMTLVVAIGMSSGAAVGFSAQAHEDFGDLDIGPHAVGFQVFNEIDHSRTFRSRFDVSGRKLRDSNARPIQVSVWYPAAGDTAADFSSMTLRDYLVLATREVDFDANPEGDVGVFLRRANVGLADEILDASTLAVREAPVESGRFPLVLYAPSLGSTSFENVVLCEYLASHGYVVAASPAVGQFDRPMAADLSDLYAQVQDLAFLSAFMREFPGADMERMGVVGFSWGGLSNVVFAMLNSSVRAVVSLDGSISFTPHKKLADETFLYDPDTLRVPFLLLSQSPWRYAEIRDYSCFDELEYSDVVLGFVHDMAHQDFASTFITLFGPIPSEGEAPTTDEDRVFFAYRVVCRYTLEFLEAFLKGSDDSATFLQRSPSENGIPDDVLSITRRAALVAPPLPDQFIEIIRSEGVSAATRIFREAKALHPDYVMFQPGQLIQLGAEYEAKGDVATAIGILELATLGAPGWYNAHDRLAMLYAENGQIDQAVQTYERFAAANPESVYTTLVPEAIKALTDQESK